MLRGFFVGAGVGVGVGVGVLVAAGVVVAGVFGAVGGLLTVAPVGVFPVDEAPFPVPVAGVEAGTEAGRDVIGVGSGGNGFDKTLATNSFMPASDLS